MHSPPLLAVLAAVLMYAVSVSPSLLPRRWWYHALVSGVSMTGGYCLGWLIQNVGQAAAEASGVTITADPLVTAAFPWVVGGLFGLWALRAIVLAYRSSREAALLVRVRPVSAAENLLGLAASLFLFFVLTSLVVLLVRGLTLTAHWLMRWMYAPVAFALVTVLGVAVVVFLVDGVVLRAGLAFFAREAALRNNSTVTGVSEPQVPQRSGSAQSLCSWSSVGAQGRTFLGLGPNRAQIEELTGLPAMEPVRVYVGLPDGPADFDAQANLAVAEMRRAGAFERSAILVSIATGSGWVDEWSVQPLEYLTRGDCATVSMQYSYLFSAAILLTDAEICRSAAIALFKAVRRAVDELPPDERPLLFIGGESLGAEAAQYAFGDLTELKRQVDGALLVGAPGSSPVLKEVTEGRHRGSPEVAPVYDSGRQVRVVGAPSQLGEDLFGRRYGPWEFPRIVFAQHATDPVVWYSLKLLFNEPDWLRERASLAVSPNMRYTYLVTAWQVACDLPMAGTVPAGHGHTYHQELIPIWRDLLGVGEAGGPARESFVADAGPALIERIGVAIAADVARSTQ